MMASTFGHGLRQRTKKQHKDPVILLKTTKLLSEKHFITHWRKVTWNTWHYYIYNIYPLTVTNAKSC